MPFKSIKQDIANGNSAAAVFAYSAALLICIWGLVGAVLFNEYRQTIAGAYKDATNYSRIFAEHTARTLQSVDQLGRVVKRMMETSPPPYNLRQFVEDDIMKAGLVIQVAAVDARADVIASTQDFTPVNLADREHIRVHMQQDTGRVFVSKPVKGRVSGKWSIQVSRRVNKPDGSFGGVVVASIDPFYFSRLYSEIDIGARGVILLAADDGIVRARRSGTDDSTGQDLNDSPLLELARKQASGTIKITSRFDQVPRYLAFWRLKDYPLIAVVGIGEEDALEPYYAYRRTVMLLAAVATIAILLMAVALVRKVRQVEENRRKAVEANAAKSTFLSNMSHELRTPLNGILGFSELLQQDLAGQPQQNFANAIHQSGQHLLTLVNSLLDLAHVEANKIQLSLSKENLPALLQRAVGRHRPNAESKSLTLELELAEGLPAQCQLDRKRLAQVLDTLLDNAIKFTTTGGILLRAEVHHEFLQFDVADTGPGIDSEFHFEIFDKFTQVDGSERRGHGGIGLGLALARELVELMGGRIWVESVPGKGSHFKFTVPLLTA